MSWNYRVIKQAYDDEDYFAIHEVYYNEDGSIRVMTESPVPVGGDSVDSLRSSLRMMLDCLDKDVLIDGKIVFVDPEAAQPAGEAVAPKPLFTYKWHCSECGEWHTETEFTCPSAARR